MFKTQYFPVRVRDQVGEEVVFWLIDTEGAWGWSNEATLRPGSQL